MSANPFVVEGVDSATPFSGAGLLDDGASLVTSIQNKDWVSAGLSVVGVVSDLVSAALNPLGALISWGVGWILDHIEPLKSWLNELTGDSGAVTAGAQTWGNIAAGLHEGAQYLMDSLTGTLAEMESTAVNAYKVLMADVAEHINLSAQVAGALSTGLEVAAGIVQFVHDLVRDAIADVVGQAISCIIPLPSTIAGVVAKVNSWATKIGTKIDELISSFDSLKKLLNKGESLLDDITEALNKIKRSILGDADVPTSTGPKPKPDTPDIDSPDVPVTDSPSQSPSSPSTKECTGTGEPVDAGTGWMYFERTDAQLAGALPLLLRRRHISGFRFGRSFGRRWASTLDEHVDTANGRLALVRWDGSVLEFPAAALGETVVPVRGSDRWRLTRIDEATLQVLDPVSGLRYRFVGRGRRKWLIETRDRADRWIQYQRDLTGMATRVVHHGGYEIAVASQNGRITNLNLITPEGPAPLTSLEYVGGVLVSETGHDTTVRYTVDELERIIGWDQNQTRYGYAYDDQDRCISEGTLTPGHEAVLRFGYRYLDGPLPGGMTTIITNPDGTEQRHESNAFGRVVRSVNGLGAIAERTLDEFGRQIAHTDPLGHVTRYEYDADSRLTKQVSPDGATTLIEYDQTGLPVRVTDANGGVTTQEFNDQGELVASTGPDGVRFACQRSQGMETWYTAELRLAARHVWLNRAGLVVKTSTGIEETQFTRDAAGRLIKVENTIGERAELTWGGRGELLSRRGFDGSLESWSYDTDGNLVEALDPAGRRTRFEYGPFGLVTAQHRPDGSVLRFGYDNYGRISDLTNETGQVWRYERDACGRIVAETDFDGRIKRYGYDLAGRQVWSSNNAEEVRQFERDSVGRVVRLTAPGVDIGYRYDRLGRMLGASGSHGELERQLDSLGRAVGESFDGRVTNRSFDPYGGLLRRVTPSGVASQWVLEPADGAPAGLMFGDHILEFETDKLGRSVQTRFAGGTIDSEFDAAGRLTRRTSEARQSQPWELAIDYTGAGEVAATRDSVRGVKEFHLDPVGRVKEVTLDGALAELYRYDPAGNLTHADWGMPTSETAKGDRVYHGTLLVQAGRDHYEYDRAGRRVRHRRQLPSGGQLQWSYAWNGLDQLVGVTTPEGHTWRYDYDPLGRRVRKVHLDEAAELVETFDFSWDGPTLVEQARTTSIGTSTTTWEHQGPNPIAQLTANNFGRSGEGHERNQQQFDQEFAAIVTDQIGMPLQTIDEHGATTWAHQPNLWGTTTDDPRMPLRYPGQYHDQETGLDYNLFRYYDPENGRYTSPDPLGLTPSPNPTTYPANPTRHSDPLGLHPSDPAAEASNWQGKGDYPGVDAWSNTTLPAGTVIYAGEPGVGSYAIAEPDALAAGNDATALYQGVQVKPDPARGYRPTLGVYQLNDDTLVGTSVTLANPQYGAGGMVQYYVSQGVAAVSTRIGEIKMVNT